MKPGRGHFSLDWRSCGAPKTLTLGARLGDGTEVVDEVGLGHANTGIADGEDLVVLVGGDADVELLAGVELGGVGEGVVADLVEGIGGVGDEFTKEDA